MNPTFGRRRIGPLAALATIGIFSITTAPAVQLVTFVKGQAIVVQSAEKRGAWYYLVLEGNGEIGIPATRIARIEEYEAPPPSTTPQPPSPVPNGAPASPVNPSVQPISPPAGTPSGAVEQGTLPPPPNTNVGAPGSEAWRNRQGMMGGPQAGGRRMGGAGGGMKPTFGRQGPYQPPANMFRRQPPVSGGDPQQ